MSVLVRGPGDGASRASCVFFDMSKRLSATDISALASMKNVAKCDTWCELQNPVNHRVFERKLRPKPLGRGHVCLGVTQRCPPNPRGRGGGRWPPVSSSPRGWPKNESSAAIAAAFGGCRKIGAPSRALLQFTSSSVRPQRTAQRGASDATPGQAGLPAEFKHINKRRKRNLQGFP